MRPQRRSSSEQLRRRRRLRLAVAALREARAARFSYCADTARAAQRRRNSTADDDSTEDAPAQESAANVLNPAPSSRRPPDTGPSYHGSALPTELRGRFAGDSPPLRPHGEWVTCVVDTETTHSGEVAASRRVAPRRSRRSRGATVGRRRSRARGRRVRLLAARARTVACFQAASGAPSRDPGLAAQRLGCRRSTHPDARELSIRARAGCSKGG
jgi:hypothetical protein